MRKVKVYQELIHDVILVKSKATLDDMPVTLRTIVTRHKQMSTLLRNWERTIPQTQRSRLTGSRIEIAILHINKVSEACKACIELDLLHMEGIHATLGGPLETTEIPIVQLIRVIRNYLRGLEI